MGARHRRAAPEAGAFGAQATVDFRVIFAPTVNDVNEAEFAAATCVELVGAGNVERDPVGHRELRPLTVGLDHRDRRPMGSRRQGTRRRQADLPVCILECHGDR